MPDLVGKRPAAMGRKNPLFSESCQIFRVDVYNSGNCVGKVKGDTRNIPCHLRPSKSQFFDRPEISRKNFSSPGPPQFCSDCFLVKFYAPPLNQPSQAKPSPLARRTLRGKPSRLATGTMRSKPSRSARGTNEKQSRQCCDFIFEGNPNLLFFAFFDGFGRFRMIHEIANIYKKHLTADGAHR